MELAGLEAAPSRIVKPPRVKASPVALECKLLQTVKLMDLEGNHSNRWLTIGQVVGVHIDDALIEDGLVDITRAKPISRLGYRDYAVIESVFAMVRPEV